MKQVNDSLATRETVIDRTEGFELVESAEFGGSQVDIYRNSNKEVFMTAKQLGEALDYSNPDIAISKIINRNNYLKSEEFHLRKRLLSKDGKRYMTTLWNKKGIRVILSLSNRPVHLKERILKLLDNQDNIVIKPREEDENITTIKNALRMFHSEREVTIGDYRVDLLFYEDNLIVECDEFSHRHYNQAKELTRELELHFEGYDFYRFNPHEKGFCVGDVVGDILEILLEGKQ